MKKLMEDKYFKLCLMIFSFLAVLILFIFMLLNIREIFSSLVWLAELFSPFILGFVFAYLLNPLVKFFKHKVFNKILSKTRLREETREKVSTFSSITSTVIFIILFVFILFYIVIPEVLKSIEVLIVNTPVYLEQIKTYLLQVANNSKNLGNITLNNYDNITKYLLNLANNTIMPKIDEWIVVLSSGLMGAIKTIFNVVMGFVISIYFLYDKAFFKAQIKKILYAIFSKKRVNSLMESFKYIDSIFSGFIMSKVLVCVVMGVITFVFMAIFKVPYAILIGLLVGVTNIIPYFGPFIGGIPSALIILLQDPSKFWLVLIYLIAIQQIESYLIEPKLLGMKTGIKSFWVLFAIIIFGGAFGLTGMIIGVPVFAILYGYASIVLKKTLKKRKLPERTEDYINVDKL